MTCIYRQLDEDDVDVEPVDDISPRLILTSHVLVSPRPAARTGPCDQYTVPGSLGPRGKSINYIYNCTTLSDIFLQKH